MPLPDVDVLAENRRNSAVHGGVVEVHDRHPLFPSLGWGWGSGGRSGLGAHGNDKEEAD